MKLPLTKDLHIRGKRVFLRADLNVPLTEQSEIEQDFRLKALLPTLYHILGQGGKIILASHIGRPRAVGKSRLHDESLSTRHLVPWFENHGFIIDHVTDLVHAHHQSKQHQNNILLLENLRFFNSEREPNKHFSELLAFLGDMYINDAFALAHRYDASVTLLAQEFDPHERAIGLLMEREIQELEKLRTNKTDPLVILVGGNKINDKLPMIEHFMDREKHPNLLSLCVGGGIGLAFLKAQGYEVGQTKIDDETIEIAQRIMLTAGENNIRLLMPLDHRIAMHGDQELSIVDITHRVPEHGTCVDIGPKTLDLFTQEIQKASLIFNNGTMGIYEQNACRTGTCGLLSAIAQAQGYSVVGGGNTVSAIHACNLQDHINFISTGGGAMLAFLGCENPYKELPALAAIK